MNGGRLTLCIWNRSGIAVAATASAGMLSLSLLAVSGKILVAFGAAVSVMLVLFLTHYPQYGLLALVFTSTSLLVPTGSYATGLPISLSRLLGVATSIGFAVWAYGHRYPLTYAPQMKWLGAFLATVALSVIVMPDTAESLSGFTKILQACLVYFLLSNVAAETRRLRTFTLAVIGTAVVASCIAAAEHYLPSLHLSATDPRLQQGVVGAIVDDESAESGAIARVSGGIGDANYLAYTLAAALPLSVYWWRIASSLRVRTFILAAALLQMAGMAFSYTRTGFLGLGMATLYLLVRKRLPLGPFLFLCVGAGVVAIYVLPPTFTERMFSSRYLKEGSTPVRRDLAYTAWELVQEKPIFGYGYGQFGPEFIRRLRAGQTLHELKGGSGAVMEEMIDKGYEAVNDLRCHNTYLEVLFEYGLVGLLPYMLFLAWVIKDLWATERRADAAHADLSVCVTAGLIAFLTCGMLGHAKILTIFWILAGLSCALRRVVLEQSVASSESVQKVTA